MAVVTEQTFGNVLRNIAKVTQTTLEPLTTGGRSVACRIQLEEVETALKRMEAYLTEGFKETIRGSSLNPEVKGRIMERIETGFDHIVRDIETLRRTYENGEPTECFKALFGKKNVLVEMQTVHKSHAMN